LPINDSARSGDPEIRHFIAYIRVSGLPGRTFSIWRQRLDPVVRFYGIQAPPQTDG